MTKNSLWIIGVLVVATLVMIAILQRSALTSSPTSSSSIPSTTTTTGTSSASWNSLINDMRPILKETFADNTDVEIERDHQISIIQEANMTDGSSVAVVGLGYGGASAEGVTVVRRDGTKPVVVPFQQSSGQSAPLAQLYGASVAQGAAVAIVSQQNAVIIGSWNNIASQNSTSSCSVTSYRWNSATKLFVFDPSLSSSIKASFCKSAQTWSGYGVFQL